MSDNAFEIRSSPKDTRQFGFEIARVLVKCPEQLPAVDAWCAVQGVKMIIARCSTDEMSTPQAMERQDYSLMDTLVYYTRDLRKTPVPVLEEDAPVRPARPGEEAEVRVVAGESFADYVSHYHADPRLPRNKCQDVFIDWAYSSCIAREVADEVYIAEIDGHIRGFATLRCNSPDEGEGVLFAVHPAAQRRGIYRHFMVAAMNWFLARGAERMVVSTQVNNIAVQKAWTRLGFEPSKSYYTFHKWYE